MAAKRPILFCNCAYAQVVPAEVKREVLKKLCDSGENFEAVADLCELSARRDPALQRLASEENLQIVACYPRAVKWLFKAAKADLRADSAIHNMRTDSAESISNQVFNATEPLIPVEHGH